MKTKICFKCNKELEVSVKNFYKHGQMADGFLNKCKECTKKDVHVTRDAKIEYYREYDRKRGNRQSSEYGKKYRKENTDKYAATTILNNAVRDGRIKKLPCVVCNSTYRIHGHHKDYTKPLEVEWRYAAHHAKKHPRKRTL